MCIFWVGCVCRCWHVFLSTGRCVYVLGSLCIDTDMLYLSTGMCVYVLGSVCVDTGMFM